MNSRRGFLKSLGAIVAAATVAPSVFLPKADDAFRWKQVEVGGLYVPNPDYFDAPYEMAMLLSPDSPHALKPLLFDRAKFPDRAGLHIFYRQGTPVKESFPIRFAADGKTFVSPYKKYVTPKRSLW